MKKLLKFVWSLIKAGAVRKIEEKVIKKLEKPKKSERGQ
jgi:hypothetical protein